MTLNVKVMPCFAPRLAVTLWLYGRNFGGISATARALVASAPNGPLAATPDTALMDIQSGDDTRSKVRPLSAIEGKAGQHAAEVKCRMARHFLFACYVGMFVGGRGGKLRGR